MSPSRQSEFTLRGATSRACVACSFLGNTCRKAGPWGLQTYLPAPTWLRLSSPVGGRYSAADWRRGRGQGDRSVHRGRNAGGSRREDGTSQGCLEKIDRSRRRNRGCALRREEWRWGPTELLHAGRSATERSYFFSNSAGTGFGISFWIFFSSARSYDSFAYQSGIQHRLGERLRHHGPGSRTPGSS